MDLTFPVKIKNVSQMIYYVGSIRFGVDEVREIHKVTYEKNKDYFEKAFERKHLVVATQTDIKEQEEKQEDKKVLESQSIIKKYKDGLHWRTVEKEVKQINDMEELKSLLQEGFDLGYDYSDIIMKRLRDSIEYLQIRQR